MIAPPHAAFAAGAIFVESGTMTVAYHTQDCFVTMPQLHRARCIVFPERFGIVMFHVPNKKNGCGVRITNVGSGQYDVKLHNEGIYRLRCSLHWSRDGQTLVIQAPPH